MRRPGLFALALVTSLFAAPFAHAERYLLDYRGSAFGFLTLGDARMDLSIEDDGYTAVAHLRSAGLAALFAPTRFDVSSAGLLENDIVRWREYSLNHRYKRLDRVVSMHPTETSVAAQIHPAFASWGNPPATDEQKRNARDPMSSLVAMSVDVGRTQQCRGGYLTFDGRYLYVLQLSGGERERYRSGGYEGPALHCDVRYTAVAGFGADDEDEADSLPVGDIWFALPPNARLAPPVRASIPLPMGRAGLHLTQYRRAEIDISDLEPSQDAPPTPRN